MINRSPNGSNDALSWFSASKPSSVRSTGTIS